MININESKNAQIKKIFFSLKILSIFFSAIPFLQYFMFEIGKNVNDYFVNVVAMIISLVVILLVIFLWTTFANKKYFKIIEMFIFIAVFVVAIYLSGAEESYYKFLFLFIIISSTIEYGMFTGIIIATISSTIIFSMDIVFASFEGFNQYLQNDLALSAMFLIVAWTLGFYVKLEKSHINELTEYANIDGLTGLYNHRYFHQRLSATCEESINEKKSLSLLIMDIDYFKSYNDFYGHNKGDELLKEIALIVKKSLRETDVFCRYGGDEFCIILPETEKDDASEIANAVREAVDAYYFEGQEYMPNNNLTISVGVSTLNNDTDTYAVLIDNADSALYRAKFLRRNKVEVYSSVFDQFTDIKDDKKTEDNLKSLKTLITVINSRDTYTFKHVERVVNYCGIMADHLQLDKEEKRCLIYSAYLHDLGKINISKDVLITDKKLTIEQWEELKRHSKDGADILIQIDEFRETAPIVLQHHEKYDGTGYPNGLSGENILYLARLLTVIDSFDAMTNQRPYQKVKTFAEAFEEIERCKGTHFDPFLADKFIEAMKAV